MLAVTVASVVLLSACGGSGSDESAIGLANAAPDTSATTPEKATRPGVSSTTPTTTTATNTASWIGCGPEGAVCTFSGTRSVRYGTEATNVTMVFTNSANCSNVTFGDPVPNAPKSCWYSAKETTAPATATAAAAPTKVATVPATSTAPTTGGTTGTGSIPTPQSIAGKRIVGRIDAVSGQVIENVHVTTTNGPCIVVPGGVTNVTIRNSEIGPCGTSSQSIEDFGVVINQGSNNITVQRNVIHDVSSGIFARDAQHPIIFDRNFVYNVRGPMWAGQVLQFNNVRGGSGRSRITCNIADSRYGNNSNVEDHFSMFNSKGSPSEPIEMAYNRIRGALVTDSSHESGTGFQTGDGQGDQGYIWIHHNTILRTHGSGISISGGTGIIVEDNRVENNGPTLGSYTGWPFTVRNYNTAHSCGGHQFNRNRGIGRLWAYNRDGSPAGSLLDYGQCSLTQSGNNFNDTTLTPAIFDEPYAECN